jgi:hypothetical protein
MSAGVLSETSDPVKVAQVVLRSGGQPIVCPHISYQGVTPFSTL